MKTNCLRKIVLLCSLVGAGSGQTRVDLRVQGNNVDFRSAPFTRPVKTGGELPTSCETGDLYFLTTASAGSNLHVCAAGQWITQGGLAISMGVSGALLTSNGTQLQWMVPGGDVAGEPGSFRVQALQNRPVSTAAPESGQVLVWDGIAWKGQTFSGQPGTITLEANGTVVGSRGVGDLRPGFGILTAVADTGSKLTIQHTADTAVLLSRSAHQGGQTLRCVSQSGTANHYSCALNPTLTSYQAGMVLYWVPDVDAAGGQTTLNIDTLGGRAIKQADGVSDPQPNDLKAGNQYAIWYDGANFRLLHPPAMLAGAAGSRPVCNAGYRGRMWMVFQEEGVADELAVCSKGSDNSFQWRVLP